MFSTHRDIALSGQGMAVGAAAFTVYCLLAIPLVRRWGPWAGSAAALAGWGVVAAVGYAVVLP
jgi:hypothetical protein